MGPEDDQFGDDGEHTPCRQAIAALEAERDRVMQGADVIDARYQVVVSERDQLAAIVARMLDGMAEAISDETGSPIDALKDGMSDELPAAVKRYLVADAYCREVRRRHLFGNIDKTEQHRLFAEWREADGEVAPPAFPE